MEIALAETPPEHLEETRRWWEHYIESRRIQALRELPPASDLGSLIERTYARASRERSWLTSMAGAFPQPLPWSILETHLRAAGFDGDLLELALRATEVLDTTYIEIATKDVRDGADDGTQGRLSATD